MAAAQNDGEDCAYLGLEPFGAGPLRKMSRLIHTKLLPRSLEVWLYLSAPSTNQLGVEYPKTNARVSTNLGLSSYNYIVLDVFQMIHNSSCPLSLRINIQNIDCSIFERSLSIRS
jgi:hypothetical protein